MVRFFQKLILKNFAEKNDNNYKVQHPQFFCTEYRSWREKSQGEDFSR